MLVQSSDVPFRLSYNSKESPSTGQQPKKTDWRKQHKLIAVNKQFATQQNNQFLLIAFWTTCQWLEQIIIEKKKVRNVETLNGSLGQKGTSEKSEIAVKHDVFVSYNIDTYLLKSTNN